MYVVPTFCEYCNASSTDRCDPATCQRPRLYFQKKRPPFCPPDPGAWDPDTDHAVSPVAANTAAGSGAAAAAASPSSDGWNNRNSYASSDDGISPQSSSSKRRSWVSGLFH